MVDSCGKLHFKLHDLYGYILFLLHVPFHLHHKSQGYPDYDLFTSGNLMGFTTKKFSQCKIGVCKN